MAKKDFKDKKSPQYLKFLIQYRFPASKNEALPIKPEKLNQLIKESSQKATQNYKKLSSPKTCDLPTYINYWTQQTVITELAKKKLIKLGPGITFRRDDILNQLNQALIRYFSLLPMEEIEERRREILDPLPYSKRELAWKKNQALARKLENAFKDLAEGRNQLAQKKGYQKYPELACANGQIPKSVFRNFNKNVDEIIIQIHQQLPKLTDLPPWFYSPLNLPCFICRLPFPDLKIPEDVFDLAEKEYPLLKDYRQKISVHLRKKTRIEYEKKTDRFRIELIKRENKRHQTLGLIHELGHAIVMIREFKKGKTPLETGKYKTEKMASEIELKLLKKLSPMVFKGRLADILLVFHRVLFEMAVYENLKQDLPQLYAKTFNRCFPEAKQKRNWLYLFDEMIVLKPLSSLPQAVAYVELLSKK